MQTHQEQQGQGHFCKIKYPPRAAGFCCSWTGGLTHVTGSYIQITVWVMEERAKATSQAEWVRETAVSEWPQQRQPEMLWITRKLIKLLARVQHFTSHILSAATKTESMIEKMWNFINIYIWFYTRVIGMPSVCMLPLGCIHVYTHIPSFNLIKTQHACQHTQTHHKIQNTEWNKKHKYATSQT